MKLTTAGGIKAVRSGQYVYRVLRELGDVFPEDRETLVRGITLKAEDDSLDHMEQIVAAVATGLEPPRCTPTNDRFVKRPHSACWEPVPGHPGLGHRQSTVLQPPEWPHELTECPTGLFVPTESDSTILSLVEAETGIIQIVPTRALAASSSSAPERFRLGTPLVPSSETRQLMKCMI